jgi:hypothetical protein
VSPQLKYNTRGIRERKTIKLEMSYEELDLIGEAINYLKNHNLESLGDPKKYDKFEELVALRGKMLTYLSMQITEIRDIWTFGGLEYDRCNVPGCNNTGRFESVIHRCDHPESCDINFEDELHDVVYICRKHKPRR